MMNGKEIAKKYLSWGLNPVPVSSGESKVPERENHNSSKMTEEEIDLYDFGNIGVSTGIISGGIEVIDFDLKNAEYPDAIMQVFKAKVPNKLLKKLVVQETISKGFHMIYRCEDISSSKKLAKSSEGKAIIETRGEGGYIKCHPSEGYRLLQGSFENIPIITPEERLQLFISAKMLNRTLLKEARKRATSEDNTYLKKFPKYNGDIEIGINLLEKYGWSIKSEDSEWFNLTRPNSSSGDIHAGYHKQGLFLFVFSTAQDVFEEERPYNNHAIFAELECEGRYDVAYAKLYEEGFGIKDEEEDKISRKDQRQKDWQSNLDSLSFLSDSIEENTYLEQVRKGEVELGLTTGWSELDKYFRFKPHTLNFGLGYDGVGKSLFMLSLATASNVMHDWKWGMVMPENKTGMSRRRLIESMYGAPTSSYRDSSKLYEKYLQESRESFNIISNQKHYSMRDVIEMGKRLYETKGINALLVDPWNFFKVSGDAYGYNNEILSELRVFAEKYCSVYVMAHPRSEATRTNMVDGYLQAPNRYSIQGGADFPYRVDDFFVTHRIKNHPDKVVKRTMQFIMEKLKEDETGGQVHNKGEWTELIWENRDGFLGYWDDKGNNPMHKAMLSRMGVRARLKSMSPEEAF